MLDALHHLSLARSAFHKQDLLNITHEADFYRLDAQIEIESKVNRLELVYNQADKKKILWNKSSIDRITDHIGRLPLVLILPDEPYLMNESSEWRRNFFDSTLSQAFNGYLTALHLYKRLLNQRNATLKYFHEHRKTDLDLLETIDSQMHLQAEILHRIRNDYLPDLANLVATEYQWISDQSEQAGLERKTEMETEDHLTIFRRNIQHDLENQRTNGGIHKDDYQFLLDEKPIKKLGSQGQQKTYLLALKLAQYRFLQKQLGRNPWLLMDDIFDKLDDTRIQKLVELVSQPTMGQVFITDARPERSKDLLSASGDLVQWISVRNSGSPFGARGLA